MKKLFVTGLVLMAFVLPLVAQVDHDYNPNDTVVGNGSVLTKDQIPATVLKAFSVDFDMSDPATWTKFPYAIKEYGWVYDKGASNVTPDRYEVSIKTKKGDDLSAVYSRDGNLISTREEFVNVSLPPSVRESLSNSKYKDWTVVGSTEIIKYYYDKNSVDQHFRLTVEKDKVRRSISFNYQGQSDRQ
jgi:hypothetical protein